jgi:hypothetical protein
LTKLAGSDFIRRRISTAAFVKTTQILSNTSEALLYRNQVTSVMVEYFSSGAELQTIASRTPLAASPGDRHCVLPRYREMIVALEEGKRRGLVAFVSTAGTIPIWRKFWEVRWRGIHKKR